jgi:methyl-accepting chemotaxis protein
MLPEFITKKVSNKIILAMFTLMTVSNLAVLYSTANKVHDDSIKTTKENLDMLNSAIFQSLRNAMNTGDPAQIKAAEDEARTIKGVKNLTIAKSQPLIEMYSFGSPYTKDKDILETFKTKQSKLLETQDSSGHNLRMIKPMIATQECLMCHANQAEGDVVGVMDLTFSLQSSDDNLYNIIMNILVASTVLGWITLGVVFYVVRKTIKPLEGLKKGFENLIESNDTSIKLKAESNDEIGEVANLFNKYMDQVNEGLKQDEKVINETNDILQKTANGFFVYNVSSVASNPHVEAMKKNLNYMIEHTKDTLDKINVTLRNYSESKFDYKIDDKGIFGDLGSVATGIKLVGNNTSEILAMIMNTGEDLNHNTHTLSNASNNLSKSSNSQAASLEETAAALDEITANIKGNTELTAKMSNLAQEVTSASGHGLELATNTATAMDEINTEVTSINDAIEVIDQIAFQTNILSLNAAVEAATAGEAGKGFAVVAQEVRNLASRSAEAAHEIKTLVESASQKAFKGKSISDDMIQGYDQLNENIAQTINMIESVAKASKDQERGIIQINDAVNSLDQATQKNAAVADEISTMASHIEKLSTSLVTAASRSSFLADARKEVCDIDLVYDTAKLKVDVLRLKDGVYSQLGTFNTWRVTEDKSLAAWIESHVTNNDNINPESISQLKSLSNSLREKLQNFVDANSQKRSNTELMSLAKEVEIESLRIFGTLNKLKKDRCQDERKEYE